MKSKVGLLVFFAHGLSLQFRKINAPDMLILTLTLTLAGIVIGLASTAQKCYARTPGKPLTDVQAQ